MRERALTVIALNLTFMGVNFSALTLFSVLSTYIGSSTGISELAIKWAAIAYSAGIFLSFFMGHSRFSEEHPKGTVLIAAILASIPQFLIPFVSFLPYSLRSPTIIGLRLMQGLVMMSVPIFSGQVGGLLKSARPFALGIILSGIFVGGFVGSSAGPALSECIGWMFTYIFFGMLMLATAFLWIFFTPKDTLPLRVPQAYAKPKRISVWRYAFTWIWGFTFFPAIWIIFTLAPLINFVVENKFLGLGNIASMSLEASYLVWSIVIGGSAYVFARRSPGEPRDLFNAFATVQSMCFIISSISIIALYFSVSPHMVIVSLIALGVIQGTAPTFWSMQATAYPKKIITKAGYALGLLANSAALIGPIVTLLTSSSLEFLWITMLTLSIFGAFLTLGSLKLKMPVEKLSKTLID